MPKNNVSDRITDREMAFARLILSGAMTDRHAAKAVGFHPASAAHIKSKPRVRAYMLEQSAAVEQQQVQQEAEGLHRLNLDREKVLGRLWEIANLSPEMTRGSITGQVKALSMIVAMQNFIPDRRAVSAEKKSPLAPGSQIPAAAWQQQAKTIHPPPSPVPAKQEDGPGVPESGFAAGPAQAPPSLPYVPLSTSVPDLGVPFPIKNLFVGPAELLIPKKGFKNIKF